jgi:hypothetical protein
MRTAREDLMISEVLYEARDEILEHLADCMGLYEANGFQREIADVIRAMDQLRLRLDEHQLRSGLDTTLPDAMQHLAEQLRDWRRDHYETLLRDWHGTAH